MKFVLYCCSSVVFAKCILTLSFVFLCSAPVVLARSSISSYSTLTKHPNVCVSSLDFMQIKNKADDAAGSITNRFLATAVSILTL